MEPPPLPRFGLRYFGGNVTTQPIVVYVLWYGNWSSLSPGTTPPTEAFRSATNGLTNSPYWRILSERLTQADGRFVTNSVSHGGDAFLGFDPRYGNQLAANVDQITIRALNAGLVPFDEHAMYVAVGSRECDPGIGSHGGFVYRGVAAAQLMHVGYMGDVESDGRLMTDAMVDTFLHEMTESASNPGGEGWKTNMDIGLGNYRGQWEIADVCDGYSGPHGGPVQLTLAGATFTVTQYLFDIRTMECAISADGWGVPAPPWVAAPRPPPRPPAPPALPQPPYPPYQPPSQYKVFSTPADDGGQLGASGVAAVATACSLIGVAVVAAGMHEWYRHGFAALKPVSLKWVSLMSAVAAFATAAIMGFAAPPSAAAPRQNAESWRLQDGNHWWAVNLPLLQAPSGSVFTPFRDATADCTALVFLAALTMVAVAATCVHDGLAVTLGAALAASMLFGCSVLSAVGGQVAITVISLCTATLAALHAVRDLSRRSPAHPLASLGASGAAALVNLAMGIMLLASCTDVAALNVSGALMATTANNDAACTLLGACETLRTAPVRLTVELLPAYAATGSFALASASLWGAASFRAPAFIVPAVAMQAATFGTWIPMVGPLSRRKLLSTVVDQAAQALGWHCVAEVPATAAGATALGVLALAAGLAAALLYEPVTLSKPGRAVWVSLLQAALLLCASVVAFGLAASAEEGAGGTGGATITVDQRSRLVAASRKLPLLDAPREVLFSPFRQSYEGFVCAAAVACVLTLIDPAGLAALAATCAALGVSLASAAAAGAAPVALAGAASLCALVRQVRSPPSLARSIGPAAVAAVLDAVAAGFLVAGAATHELLRVELFPDVATRLYSAGLYNSAIVTNMVVGSTVQYEFDMTVLCAYSGAFALLACMAWVAYIALPSHTDQIATFAVAVQALHIGGSLPFERLLLRRRILPDAVVQIAAAVGWGTHAHPSLSASAGSWCALLACVATLAFAADSLSNVSRGIVKRMMPRGGVRLTLD